MTAQAIPFRRGASSRADDRPLERGPRMFPLMLFALAAVAVFFSMIFLRISLDETAFELSELEAGIATEQSLQLDLRYDLASLQDPLRIATEAQRIGLVYPDERLAIVVDRIAVDPQVLEPDRSIRALDGARP